MKKIYKWFINYREYHTETNDDKKEK